MKLDIHGSKLDSYADCPRRGAAEIAPHLLKAKGYEIKNLPTFVTPLIGTAIHAGVELMHNYYIKNKVLPDASILANAFESAIDKYNQSLGRELMSREVRMVAKFASNEQISSHIREYLDVYYRTILPDNKAKLSEVKFEIKLLDTPEDQIRYVSSLDNFTEDGTLRDLKTGAKKMPAYHQMGVYVFCLTHTGEVVKKVQLDYMIRPRDGMPPVHVPIVYDPDTCLTMTKYITTRVINDFREFEKTGDINVFPPNPRSEGCNNIMCPLWGTKTCGGWKKD